MGSPEAVGWGFPNRKAAGPEHGPRKWPLRVVVGAIVSFGFLSVLYGVQQAVAMVAILVVCTIGIGLIPVFFVSYIVGWVVVDIYERVGSRIAARQS